MIENVLLLILAAPACAWAIGIAPFQAIFFMGVMCRWLPGGELPGLLAHMGSTAFLIASGVIAAVEFVFELISGLDVRWDKWTGHLRVLMAGIISYLIMSSEDITTRLIMAGIGMFLATLSYASRSGARRAAYECGTGVFVAPVTGVTESCLVGTIIFPLSAMIAISGLMMGFMFLGAMVLMYVIWADVRVMLDFIFTGIYKPLKKVVPNQKDEVAT